MAAFFDEIRAEIVDLTDAVDANGRLLVHMAERILAAPTLAEAHVIAQAIKDEKEQLVADALKNTPAEPTP